MRSRLHREPNAPDISHRPAGLRVCRIYCTAHHVGNQGRRSPTGHGCLLGATRVDRTAQVSGRNPISSNDDGYSDLHPTKSSPTFSRPSPSYGCSSLSPFRSPSICPKAQRLEGGRGLPAFGKAKGKIKAKFVMAATEPCPSHLIV